MTGYTTGVRIISAEDQEPEDSGDAAGVWFGGEPRLTLLAGQGSSPRSMRSTAALASGMPVPVSSR